MQLKRGLWLTMLDEAGEATPVACNVEERRPGLWILEALIPPQVYPVRFEAAQLRLDGHHLGRLQLPQPIVTVTHQPLELRLEFPVNEERVAALCAKQAS
ncbi:MAG TPA: hypothetical protein VFU47_17195 [Armatimonadota bacterium]|nr:hypothetical protein [Armatimonadota bacterium]